MAITVRELLVKLGVQADTQAVNRFDQGIDRAKQSMREAAGQASNLTAGIRGLLVQVAGLEAMRRAAVGLFTVNAEVQRLNASLETVTGSQAAATAAFEDIKEFTRSTPFQLQQVTDSYIKLKAQGIEPTEERLRSFGNTASAMGKDLDQFIEAVLDAQTGEFERLKEFGIKAKSEGDNVVFTFRGVETKMKKTSANIVDFLTSIGENEFGGAMARQMDTLGGRMSNLQDNIFLFALAVGEGGLNDALSETLDILIGATGESDNAAKSIGEKLAVAVRKLNDGLRLLIANGDEVIRVFKVMAIAFAAIKAAEVVQGLFAMVNALRAVGAAATLPALKLAIIAAAILLVVLVIQDLIVFLNTGDSALAGFFSVFSGFSLSLGQFGPLISSIIDSLVSMFRAIAPVIMELVTTIIDVIAAILPIVVDIVGTIITFILSAIDLILAALDAILPPIIAVVAAIVRVMLKIVPPIAKMVRSIFNLILGVFEAFKGPILEILPTFKAVFAFIADVIVGFIDLALPLIVDTFESLASGLEVLVDIIIAVFDVLAPVIVELSTVIFQAFKAIARVIGAVVDFFVSAWEEVEGPFKEVWEGLKTTVEEATEFMAAKILPVIDGMKEIAKGTIRSATESVGEFIGAAQNIQQVQNASGTQRLGSVQVGDVSVNVEGSADMTPEEFQKATQAGIDAALNQVMNNALQGFAVAS